MFPGTGEPDLEAVAEMVAFLSDIDPLYRWNAAPQPLRIGGAWLTDLQSRRNQQLVAYEEGNLSKIAQLHENMFFNELIAGLWNYGYINDGKVDAQASLNFQSDYEEVLSIWPDFADYSPPSSLSWWGFGFPGGGGERGSYKFTDPWHFAQSKLVLNALNLAELGSRSCRGVLEIGSGYGGLVYLLANAPKVETIVLVDIPLNFLTCFYFLKRSLPEGSNLDLSSGGVGGVSGLTFCRRSELCHSGMTFCPMCLGWDRISMFREWFSLSSGWVEVRLSARWGQCV